MYYNFIRDGINKFPIVKHLCPFYYYLWCCSEHDTMIIFLRLISRHRIVKLKGLRIIMSANILSQISLQRLFYLSFHGKYRKVAVPLTNKEYLIYINSFHLTDKKEYVILMYIFKITHVHDDQFNNSFKLWVSVLLLAR